MAKRADLSAFQVRKPAAEPSSAPKRAKRDHKLKTKAFELKPEAARQFEILKAETGKTGIVLIAEAMNMLFKQYGKPQLG